MSTFAATYHASTMIILVGPFPPPVHGASTVTRRLAERLHAGQVSVVECSTSSGSGTSGLRHHVGRIRAYCRAYLALLRRHGGVKPTAVYVSLSGGWGLVYDMLLVVIARARRYDLIFHHHTFAYITHPSRIMHMIVRIGGKRQRHIALCPTMVLRLAAQYGSWLKFVVISNLLFLDIQAGPPRSSRPIAAIGYLSNISFEKGIDRYLDVMAALRSRGSRIAGIVAGPFNDGQMQSYVERRIREIGNMEYCGPVYGERKQNFLSSIDLLVFPSRADEAQPLVVHEAQAAGVMVAASNCGCIGEPMNTGSLLLLDSTTSNLDPLIEQILAWENDPAEFERATHRFRGGFGHLLEQRAEYASTFSALFSAHQ